MTSDKIIIQEIAKELECKIENIFDEVNDQYRCYSEWAEDFIVDSLLKNKKIRKICVEWEKSCVKKLRIICTDYPYILYSMKNKNTFNELTFRCQIPDSIGKLKELCRLDICAIGVGFSEKIWNLKSLISLNIYCPNWKGICGWKDDLINLKRLSLVKISKQFNISKLKQLEILDISESSQLSLPTTYFQENIQLIELNITCSPLQILPLSLYKLMNLKILNLESTDIKILLPEIGKMENLCKLYLSGTRISLLPDEVTDCTNLDEITFPSCLTKLPIGIGKLNKLKELDLDSTKITSLPESITELKELQRLTLPKTLTYLPEDIGLLEKLQILDLQYTSIEYLPDSIGKLNSLRRVCFPKDLKFLPNTIGGIDRLNVLNLKRTKITNLPNSVGRMEKLTEVIVPSSLSELPESIKSWKNVKELDLQETKIEKLPEGIGGMKSLEYLKLPNCLKELPRNIGGLQNLKELDLKDTKLIKLPEEISDLRNLTLILFPRALKKLPKMIGRLSKIKCLDLRNTKIIEIPDSIVELSNLEELYAPNLLKNIPLNIGKLKKLKILNLEHSEFKYLPDDIVNLKNLKYLKLSHSSIRELPSNIGRMQNLEELYLDNTGIRQLPNEICILQHLKKLHLEKSKLSILPENIGYLHSLIVLNLDNTPISKIPDSVEAFISTSLTCLSMKGVKLDYVSKGLAKLVLNTSKSGFFNSSVVFLQNIKILNQDIALFECSRKMIESFYSDPLVRLNECKVIFLGDGNVGKSSLIDRIIENQFQLNRQITNGISIRKWWTHIKDELVKIRFWDFGGQEIIHTMHLCFLTQRSIYVIVLDSRQDQYLEKIAIDWLQTVKTFAPQAPVILVLNKCDINQRAMLNLASLKESYPQLVDCIRTSALSGENINTLKSLIIYSIRKYSSYSVVFNQRWVEIKEVLENMITPYISNNEYVDLCMKYGIESEMLQINLLDLFSDLGVLYHYSDYDFRRNPEAINVLNPEWVTNGISRLIIRSDAKNGLISHKEIYDVLSKSYKDDVNPSIIYDRNEVKFILDVMRQKGMSLRLDKKELIPMKLDYFSPRINDILREKEEKNLHFAIKGDYLPNSIIHRLIIERIHEVKFEKMWRNGVVLYNKELSTKAVIILRYDSRYRLDIYIQSQSNTVEKEVLSIIRDNILKILRDFHLENYEEVICYNLPGGKQGEEPYMRVWKPFLQGIETIYLPSSDCFASPATLLNSIYTQKKLEEIKEEKIMMNNSFYNYGNIEGSNILLGKSNEVNLKDPLKDSRKIQRICKIDDISKEQYEELIILFEQLIEKDELSEEQRVELMSILDSKNEKKNCWKRIKEFMSNTANFITIFGIFPDIANKICELLLD